MTRNEPGRELLVRYPVPAHVLCPGDLGAGWSARRRRRSPGAGALRVQPVGGHSVGGNQFHGDRVDAEPLIGGGLETFTFEEVPQVGVASGTAHFDALHPQGPIT